VDLLPIWGKLPAYCFNAPKSDVTVLGIDDFAMRRGDKYGTILINIETSKPIDLLADRTAEAVKPWLSKHSD